MAEVTASIQVFMTTDCYPLYYRQYRPADEIKGHIVCIHGIQSHGGWYEGSCTQMAAAGYLVSYLDRRGSGLNWICRGDAPSYRRLIADVREFLRIHATRGPVYLLATSWGGKLGVSLAAELDPPMQKLVLLCPGLFPKIQPPLPTRLAIGRARLSKPRRMFSIPLNDPQLFTSSPQWQHFLKHDPLALHHATARLLVESVRLDRHVRRIGSISLPTLLLLGGQDRIIRNDRTQEWLQKVSPQANVITYPECHHTFEFEENCAYVRDILAWIAS